MHDLEFDHMHMAPGEEVNEVAWSADNVELITVGIDIGSSTSHLMFAQVHLQRLGTALSSRFVVVNRRIIWQSPILLTPYLSDYTIDTDELAGFIGGCYQYADLEPADIDSGAVILTGEAIKRRNARAIADLFSEEAGRFVCASAGHHMECQLSAHGSGAVALSRGHNATLLNVDIGGGTTKLTLIEKGRILATLAIAVGGRLLVEDPRRGLVRIEDPAREVAASVGIELKLGEPLKPDDRARIVTRMVGLIMSMIDLRAPNELARRLLVTDPWSSLLANKGIDALTFSGGVAEYLYKRENRRFGDLGEDLARELAHALAHRRDLPPVWDPGQGIRATVIGAAQFSVQTSGNTIAISRPEELPLQNLPVLACEFALGETIRPDVIAATIRHAMTLNDIEEGESPVAIAFPWSGDPSYARLAALARGICAALPKTLAAELPVVLLIDGDVGMSLGRIIRSEIAPGAEVIAIDGVQLKQFDYVDIGRVIEVTNVVPIIIKSLLFK
jgi:ethanolamine utilization protein EutA